MTVTAFIIAHQKLVLALAFLAVSVAAGVCIALFTAPETEPYEDDYFNL